MSLSTPCIIGNWKMNGLRADGLALAQGLAERRRERPDLRGTLAVCPPATLLAAVAAACAGSGVDVGGQDCHEEAKGAFTGSLSAPMLADAGGSFVLVGHSERRQGPGVYETSELIAGKVTAALAAGLAVVLCVGESEAEWMAGRTVERIETQLDEDLARDGRLLEGLAPERLVVAYEPLWAIGTGRTPAPDDIARSHAAIRARLAAAVPGGESVPILYGGSAKPDNAASIMAVENVDGLLVGGASLDGAGFWSMFEQAPRP